MKTYNILELQKLDKPELQDLAADYNIETEEKDKQDLIYAILDAQNEVLSE